MSDDSFFTEGAGHVLSDAGGSAGSSLPAGSAEAVLAQILMRHKRQGRPKIAECACGQIVCTDLAILEQRTL